MKFLQWLMDGNGRYMNTFTCIGGDKIILTLTSILNSAVIIGYLIIAWHYFKNSKRSAGTKGEHALKNLVMVFVFCGITGYGFQIIRFFAPLWPVYLFMLLILNIATYRYIFSTNNLSLIYKEMDKRVEMARRIIDIVDSVPQDISEEDSKDQARLRFLLAKIKQVVADTSKSIDQLSGEYSLNEPAKLD